MKQQKPQRRVIIGYWSVKHLTLVSPGDRARSVQVRLDLSLPPLLSPGEAQPPLCPAVIQHTLVGQGSISKSAARPSTYRELHLVVLVAGHEWPPALDPLLFEDGDGGKLLLFSDHIQGTLLGCLGPARKPV